MTEEPDIVERLRNYNTCSDTDVDEAADEIERLRKELYEAQIIAVHQSALLLKKSPKEIADQMNWNCLDDKDNINA